MGAKYFRSLAKPRRLLKGAGARGREEVKVDMFVARRAVWTGDVDRRRQLRRRRTSWPFVEDTGPISCG